MIVEPTEFINVFLVFDGILLVGTNFRVILRTNFDHQYSSVRVLLKNCASIGTTVWHIQPKVDAWKQIRIFTQQDRFLR